MIQPWRLETISLSLADAFKRASQENRRRAAILAVESAVMAVGLEADVVRAALRNLRNSDKADPPVQLGLQALASGLDDAYLSLAEQTDRVSRVEALRLFRQARAASALELAVGSDRDQLHEAVYEALISVNDDGLIRRVEAALD